MERGRFVIYDTWFHPKKCTSGALAIIHAYFQNKHSIFLSSANVI